MTTFSIVIPTYNRQAQLLECLASIATQCRTPEEVIVVDDGSTDGTCEALAGMPGVTMIKQANAGPGCARNRGAAAASGDYIAFLDSDDIWFPWALEVIATLVERHDRPALLSTTLEDYRDVLPIISKVAPKGLWFPDFLAAARHPFFVGAGTIVVERVTFGSVGGFREDRLNGEDHDLTLRLGVVHGFVQILAPTILARRLHTGNAIGNFRNTVTGTARLIEMERSGNYPGGVARRNERQKIIARHTRPVVVAALKKGCLSESLTLYWATFLWNAKDARAAFLAAVPVLALVALGRRTRAAVERLQ